MRLASLASAAAIVVLAALSFPGCSQQGEAMRCEVGDDCESGLICTNVGFADKICCPENRARATTSECKNGATTTPTDTGVAAETATDTATASETATDSTTDTAKPETATDTGTAADTTTATDADAAD